MALKNQLTKNHEIQIQFNSLINQNNNESYQRFAPRTHFWLLSFIQSLSLNCPIFQLGTLGVGGGCWSLSQQSLGRRREYTLTRSPDHDREREHST